MDSKKSIWDLSKVRNRYILCGLSALLLSLAWPTSPLFPLAFVGFAPLLLLERAISNLDEKHSNRKIFGYTYLTLLLWNVITTWWVWFASPGGSVAAFVLNAGLQSVPFMAFHWTRIKMGDKLGYISLPIYWITFEYIHLSWEFTWPWLTVGNVFAMAPWAVQWYEWTGALGGSLWVLVVNILVLLIFISEKKKSKIIQLVMALCIPLIVSLLIPVNQPKGQESFEVMVVQPNVDPYTEKFSKNVKTDEFNRETFIPYEQQVQNLIDLTKANVSDKTTFVLWPETSVHGPIVVPELAFDKRLLPLRMLVNELEIKLVTGTTTFEIYPTAKEASSSARSHPKVGYYDVCNSAIYYEQSKAVECYHKSKLVPGVERLPYPGFLTFLKYFSIDLGGVAGTLGLQKEREVFTSVDKVSCAPVICYESIYGGYVTDYFEQGADFIGVITNDGWWHDTQGHKQHFNYARLRAIENRSWVARSANTGISGFIAPDGTVAKTLTWDKKGTVKHEISKRWKETWYTKYGDYLGRVFAFLSIALLLSICMKYVKRY